MHFETRSRRASGEDNAGAAENVRDASIAMQRGCPPRKIALVASHCDARGCKSRRPARGSPVTIGRTHRFAPPTAIPGEKSERFADE